MILNKSLLNDINISSKIKRKYFYLNKANNHLLVGKDDELLLLKIDNPVCDYDEDYYTSNLYKIHYDNNEITLEKVLLCEYSIPQNYSHLFLQLIVLNETRENLSKGYGTIMINFLENLCFEKKISNIFGVYMPIGDGIRDRVKKFYTRNNFKINENRDISLKKDKKDFRKMIYEDINNVKVENSILSNLYLIDEEENQNQM